MGTSLDTARFPVENRNFSSCARVIPSSGTLSTSIEGRSFSIDAIVRGSQRILWGFFLKLMIADKAAVAVNEIFNNYGNYEGAYVWVAGILYSIQGLPPVS